jgi:hypothetical protein
MGIPSPYTHELPALLLPSLSLVSLSESMPQPPTLLFHLEIFGQRCEEVVLLEGWSGRKPVSNHSLSLLSHCV